MGAPTPESTADFPPPDFTLEVTLIAPPMRQDGSRPPRLRRSTRFVIETDWVLRSYSGRAPVGHDTFPRETRQLTEHEIAAIWGDLRDAGLLDPAHPSIVGSAPAPADVSPSEPVLVISIVADGDRRTLALAPDGPGEALFSRLADLAWLPK